MIEIARTLWATMNKHPSCSTVVILDSPTVVDFSSFSGLQENARRAKIIKMVFI